MKNEKEIDAFNNLRSDIEHLETLCQKFLREANMRNTTSNEVLMIHRRVNDASWEIKQLLENLSHYPVR